MSDVEITLTLKLKVPDSGLTAAELEEAVHQEVVQAAYKHHLHMQILAQSRRHTAEPELAAGAQFQAGMANILALHKTWAEIVQAAEVDVMLRALP